MASNLACEGLLAAVMAYCIKGLSTEVVENWSSKTDLNQITPKIAF
jgi:hypothetical protein